MLRWIISLIASRLRNMLTGYSRWLKPENSLSAFRHSRSVTFNTENRARRIIDEVVRPAQAAEQLDEQGQCKTRPEPAKTPARPAPANPGGNANKGGTDTIKKKGS
jgi:hypothetical protein